MLKFLHRVKRSLLRRTDEFLRTSRLLRRWRIEHAVDAGALVGNSITNMRVIVPAQSHVSLEPNSIDRLYLQVSKYFNEGWYARPDIFVCEIPDAFCHVGAGMICTRDFVVINESQMAYRVIVGPVTAGNRIHRLFQGFKPLRPRRLAGLYATIGNVFMRYWGHWLFDCLPRLYSLEKTSAGEHVILLVPDDLPDSWNDSLACVLPSNFEIRRLPDNSWVQAERMLLASYPSSRANNHMPTEFYDFIRQACFAKFGLAAENRPSERIYISRAGTRHRRIVNEKALIELLSRYGFKVVALEKLNFRQQVELFHGAEIIVAADGSNWADMMFAGKIKIFVLYADHQPNTHWFTAAKGLGQQHYFFKADEPWPHADFSVDIVAVESVLQQQMELRPTIMAPETKG